MDEGVSFHAQFTRVILTQADDFSEDLSSQCNYFFKFTYLL